MENEQYFLSILSVRSEKYTGGNLIETCRRRVFCLCLFLVCLWAALSFGQFSTYDEVLEQSKTISVEVDPDSGLSNPVFEISDSINVDVITRRISLMFGNLDTLECKDCVESVSTPGYRGLVIRIGNTVNHITIRVFDEKMAIHRNPVESKIWKIHDQSRKFERIIAVIAARENLRATVSGSEKNFIEIVYTSWIQKGK